jgi:hypothetical protein
MNKEFVKKMVMAEKLKYEAIMEILPSSLRERVENLGKDAFNLIKDISTEMMKEEASDEADESQKTTKRVNVDFS